MKHYIVEVEIRSLVIVTDIRANSMDEAKFLANSKVDAAEIVDNAKFIDSRVIDESE